MRHPLRENFEITDASGTDTICCSRCRSNTAAPTKIGGSSARLDYCRRAMPGDLMSLLDGQYLLRQFYCPSCATLVDTDFVDAMQHDGGKA